MSGVGRAVSAEPVGIRVGMADYRTCTVGHDRHFIGHRAFVCENDADATEWAKQQLTVTKLSFGTRGASSPCSQCEKRAPGGDYARGRVTVSRKPAAHDAFGRFPGLSGRPDQGLSCYVCNGVTSEKHQTRVETIATHRSSALCSRNG